VVNVGDDCNISEFVHFSKLLINRSCPAAVTDFSNKMKFYHHLSHIAILIC